MEKKLYGTVLIKAAKIIDVLSENGEQTIQMISQKTQITASTVTKILETLIFISYVAKNEDTKKYRLGTKFLHYRFSKIAEQELVNITEPFLEELQSKVDETIHLAIPLKNEVVYLNKLEPKNQNIYMSSKIGMTRSLYSSGMGKIVLSSFDDKDIKEYLNNTILEAKTSYTITDPKDLWKEIEKMRSLGYAIDDEEQELDCYCIATTLKKEGKVIGAMSMSVPKFRMTSDYQSKIIRSLMETKEKIENIL